MNLSLEKAGGTVNLYREGDASLHALKEDRLYLSDIPLVGDSRDVEAPLSQVMVTARIVPVMAEY